jgi:holo-[acyl-carrier protein] synthase
VILGTGSDLVNISRIEKIIENHGRRFIERCFSEEEIKLAEKRKQKGDYSSTFAKRFAAKEACSKALGTGFRDGVFLKDISVETNSFGKPEIKLVGGAYEVLCSMVPAGMAPRIHLSLSDEPPLAQAIVMIEAVEMRTKT